MKKALIILVLLVANIAAFSTNYYVRKDGNSTNAGTSNTASGAWSDIGTSISKIAPGDTLFIADGTWVCGSLNYTTLKNGTNTNRYVIKAINKWGAKIQSTGGNDALNFMSCKGITVDGLEIFYPAGVKQGKSILVLDDGDWITVRNCKAYGAPLGGIGGNSDHYILENNVIYDCCWQDWNVVQNTSGINLYGTTEKSAGTIPGTTYGVIIRNNIIYHCWGEPYGGHGPTDGNGIIIDDWNKTQGEGTPQYKKGVLIENNLIYNCGGSGVSVYDSDNAMIRNNTFYYNQWKKDQYADGKACGDIDVTCETGKGNNNKIYNNISIKNPSLSSVGIRLIGETNWVAEYNVVSSSNSKLSATNIMTSNVNFVNASIDPIVADFHLLSTSPAINAGNNSFASTNDLDGNIRPNGSTIDMGCYEYYPLAVITARGELLPNNGYANAGDGLATTTWIDISKSTWLQYSFLSTYKYNTYTLTTVTDVSKDPKDWTIQASSNGTDWVTLDTKTNESLAERKTVYTYSFVNEANYEFYKIDITANNGNDSTEIAELTYSYVDRTNPTPPTNLAFSNTSYNLSWTASTDNIAVTSYQIYDNGVLLGTSSSNSFALKSFQPNTNYSFTVKAADVAGNFSDLSEILSFKTGVFSSYEAEFAVINGGLIATDHPGYTGSGFWGNVGSVGNYLEFTVYSENGGSTDLSCRFSSGGSNKTMNLYVNGIKIRTETFPSTSGWDNWSTKVENVSLNAGNNTIKYQYDSGNTGYINVDYIAVKPNPTGVSSINSKANLIVFPNPAKDWITIQNVEQNSIIRIISIEGKVVHKSVALTIGNFTIPVSNWERGVYLITVKNNSKIKMQEVILN